jgi:hypothetical protein
MSPRTMDVLGKVQCRLGSVHERSLGLSPHGHGCTAMATWSMARGKAVSDGKSEDMTECDGRDVI